MKNTFKLFGIIAVIAVISFSMAGCDNGSPAGPGSEPPPPPPPGFTVTFVTHHGTPLPDAQTVEEGGFATRPPTAPIREFVPGAGLWAHPMPTATTYTFDGWFAPEAIEPFDFENTPITENITITAHWTPPAMPIAADVAAAMAHVSANAGTFTLLVGAPASHDGAAWTLAENVDLTIEGFGLRQTITRTGTGSLFNITGANRSLTLGYNITLAGNAGNTLTVVQVGGTASLTMNDGAWITGNTTSSDHQGGAVNVEGTGTTFTMLGGVIRGNTTAGLTSGGGVRVATNASFVMHSGAVIEGNTAGNNSGGGVLMLNADTTFTMLGGAIRGNSATGANNTAGGVRVGNGEFRMVNGVITAQGPMQTRAPSTMRCW